jgi:hypothetical protein
MIGPQVDQSGGGFALDTLYRLDFICPAFERFKDLTLMFISNLEPSLLQRRQLYRLPEPYRGSSQSVSEETRLFLLALRFRLN